MSHDELRTEYERLRAQIGQLLQNQPPSEAESSEAWQLLAKLQVLTKEYDQKLYEAEAQIADAQPSGNRDGHPRTRRESLLGLKTRMPGQHTPRSLTSVENTAVFCETPNMPKEIFFSS